MRPIPIIDQVFDLFDQLGATDEQLDFPIIYASSINGYASLEDDVRSGDMTPMFETIVAKVAAPEVDVNAPLQMQITALGPSCASTNSKTESTIDNTRSTSPPKSACPGVSTILI
jgi:predicted membrane GTPase involved in stress response